MRSVAAELGATTGVLTHYFSSKRELTAYALNLLETRSATRSIARAAPGANALLGALLNMLSLTHGAAEANRIWVSSWGEALVDPEFVTDYAAKYSQSRSKVQALIVQAQGLGEFPSGDAETIAAQLHSLVLGLVVQAFFDPEAFPPQRQVALLNGWLTSATSHQGNAVEPEGVGGDAADIKRSRPPLRSDGWRLRRDKGSNGVMPFHRL